MTQAIKITDRYQALGMAAPDPETMCGGQCEGVGRVPVTEDDDDPAFRALWRSAEDANPAADGWHFVDCPDCDGTGKARP